MKIYDFDGMFDQKLSDYMAKNSEKYSAEEWEDIVPKLYEKFGNTQVKQIGKTPNEYYASLSDGDLIQTLSTHLKKGVAVPEFLVRAIEGRNCTALLLPLLYGSEEEISCAMRLLAADSAALPRYMALLTDENTPADVKDACAEYLKERADEVKEAALSHYAKGVERAYMTEILSHCVIKDERIFEILVGQFRTERENPALFAAYLAAYGDERALPFLYEKIAEEGIGYVEYRELKYAIESLGGEYADERDFSSDPAYELIKSHGADITDIFKNFK